ncbi:hypothetical protein Pcac1_g14185 [Phytophthora cactorum]|nr:hypothetical protein Pcac1_g14185 [Phytophthora cactorum]
MPGELRSGPTATSLLTNSDIPMSSTTADWASCPRQKHFCFLADDSPKLR